MRARIKNLVPLFMAAAGLFGGGAVAKAQQQQQGVCSRVKMVIEQELTLERIGFEATLEITNNDGGDPITDFFADLTFENPLNSTADAKDDANDLFFVRAPTFENINGVSGDGVIGPTRTAVIRWFIIPKIAAGGESPNGIRYQVSCRLSGKFRGEVLPSDVLQVFPDTIVVKPEPQLEITYFQPRDVQGDDPFTEIVESPIPFTLGVLVKNSGFGLAKSVKINSQQPKIVENKRNLLLIAQLIGARVMDSPLDRASLLVNLGDIPPGEARKGAWDMITSLSGEFVEFRASYTHASELGGEETSVIKSLNAHFIAREALNDQAGRDDILDFFADTDRDAHQIPDALYESEGNVLPVNYLSLAEIQGSAGPGGSFSIELTADKESWGYVRLNDPGQARLKIARVVRDDGKVIHPRNYWTNFRYEEITNNRLNYFNLLDKVELRNYTYTVTYAAGESDVVAPETTIEFAGVVSFSGGKYYIVPSTQIYFISEDENPVSIQYKVNDGEFLPAIPFQLSDPGEYLIEYFATDSSQNEEVHKTATVVISDNAPLIADVALSEEIIFSSGNALSVRPETADMQFQVAPHPVSVSGRVDVFRGAKPWPQISGVPSTPTTSTAASLTVSGDGVDFYKYRLDQEPWSGEFPAAQPIELSGLSVGHHSLSVLGRPQGFGFPPDAEALAVQWEVNDLAFTTMIVGAPPTPTRQRNAELTVSGDNVTDYRWTINDGFYRAETSVADPVSLGSLSDGLQKVSVLGKSGGVLQTEGAPTEVSWLIDPDYGADYLDLTLVRSVEYEAIGTDPVHFQWDGRDDDGNILTPGWYTVRLTLEDELGRKSYAVRRIEIGEIVKGEAEVAGTNRGPRKPQAHGPWVVWQDQSQGSWNIYARNLLDESQTVMPLTDAALDRENPRTDGRFAVWQGRREDGGWDVFLKDLTAADPVVNLTDSLDAQEVNPVVEWPWVLWQSKPANNPDASWSLRALNLATEERFAVAPEGTQDQMDPWIGGGRAVWQDHRDVGFGEIYFRDLEAMGPVVRVTENSFGQYHPAIDGHWIVWQDNRNQQVDIYGYDLLRKKEVRLTDTPWDESLPYLEDPWMVYTQHGDGVGSSSLALYHLNAGVSIPLTRSDSMKDRASFASGQVVWEDQSNGATSVRMSDLPAVQAVFNNRNAIAVTEGMAGYQRTAFELLENWQSLDIDSVTRFTSLVPDIVSETAAWDSGVLTGDNFPLEAGSFIWVKFNGNQILDLGNAGGASVDLAAGVNALNYTRFPISYSAYKLLGQLGSENAVAVRMLDSLQGRWMVASVDSGGGYAGHDFRIPSTAVVLIEMAQPLNEWKPE